MICNDNEFKMLLRLIKSESYGMIRHRSLRPSPSAKSSMSNIVGLFFCVFKFYVDKKVTFRLAIHYLLGGEKLLFVGRKVAFYPFASYQRNG